MSTRQCVKCTVFVLAMCGLMFTAAIQPSESEDDHLAGELIVSFIEQDAKVIVSSKPRIVSMYEPLNGFFQQHHVLGVKPLFRRRSPVQNVYLFEFPDDADLGQLASILREFEFVKHVNENETIVTWDVIPNDSAFNIDWACNGQHGINDQWTFWKTQLDRAWDVTRGDSSVVIAVIDGGFAYLHPDLNSNIWVNPGEDINGNGVFDNYSDSLGGDIDSVDNDGNDLIDDVIGWDFWDDDNTPTPAAHGTLIASIIAGVTDNNGLGSAGVTWHGKIMTLAASTSTQLSHLLNATQYAVEMGADVVNMSFSVGPDSAWHEAIMAGTDSGMIFVSSAGGFGVDLEIVSAKYPQAYEEVLAIASVDSSGYALPTKSNYGDPIVVCAYSAPSGMPLKGIVTSTYSVDSAAYCGELYPGGEVPYQFAYTGSYTSGASAHVSGLIALLKSVYPNASREFLVDELERGYAPSQIRYTSWASSGRV